jgi:hypothetical protein
MPANDILCGSVSVRLGIGQSYSFDAVVRSSTGKRYR